MITTLGELKKTILEAESSVYDELCEELEGMFIAEYGEEHVEAERQHGEAGPNKDAVVITVTYDFNLYGLKDIVNMMKNTCRTVTGEEPIDMNWTNSKTFVIMGVYVSSTWWDEQTLRVAVVQR